MSDLQYLDFDLTLERAANGYRVEVTRAPAGNARAEFTLPFSDIEIENVLLKLGGARRRTRRVESPEMDAAKNFGGKLFNAVFTGDVRGVYAASMQQANAQTVGLRLRLHLDEAPELADLPWEFLYNPSLNRFLALSVKTPIVRYLELPEQIRPLALHPPLNVLVMISSPTDYETLDVEREWRNLSAALRDLTQRGMVTLERVERATLTELQNKLQARAYHIFHFIGHGAFDERAQDGVLILENENERGRRVSAQTLGAILHDHASLRLAVLNACEGARTSRTDPFAGVASSLVQQGIPAVIAMQFEISDDAATTFARGFYQALASGYPVDAALSEVRKAIFADNNEMEWGTPVLYLRAADGKIFDIPPDAQIAAPVAITPDTPRATSFGTSLRAVARKPVTWIVAAAVVVFALVALYLLLRPAAPNVQIGQMTTAARVATGPVPDTYLPMERGDEFTRDTPALYVVLEMLRVPKDAKLDLRVWQAGGFEKNFPSNTRTRDIQNEANAWWYFVLSPQEICASPQAQCPGTFHAQLVVNGAPENKEAVFSILDAPARASPTALAISPSPAPTETVAPTRAPIAETATAPAALFAGTIQARGADNAPMVYIPAGTYTIGNDAGAEEERPAHAVFLDAFWIDQHEVTNAQYRQCSSAGKCMPPVNRSSNTRETYYDNPKFDNYPVIFVSWQDAANFCKWAGKRLPTEAEWESAGRGVDARLYPWGNEFDEERVNAGGAIGDTSAVGSYPNGASEFGVLDLSGNVWEWVADWYSSIYYRNAPRENPQGPAAGTTRGLRGGSWDMQEFFARLPHRGDLVPDNSNENIGFRCAQSDAQTAETPTAPQATPMFLPSAPSLIIQYVIPADQLTPTEMELDNSLVNLGPNAAQEFLRVTRVAYGELEDGKTAFDVRVVVKNPTDAAIRLQVDTKFFSLQDRLGREANLIYFCCATPETFLGANQEREIQLVFESRPEWGGKGGESLSSFVVRGFLPVVRAAWEVPLPVTAE